MKRSLVYHPPREQEVLGTFAKVEQVEAFLLRWLHAAALPYLRLPYLIFGTTDHISQEAPSRPVVVAGPRVYVLAVPGEDGFLLRVEQSSAMTVEEEDEGRWRVSEDFEPVDAPQLRVWHIGRAWLARCDGFEELRIDFWPTVVVGEPGRDAAEPEPPLYAIRYDDEGRRCVPLAYEWLRLSLEDAGKVRGEDHELAVLAAML